MDVGKQTGEGGEAMSEEKIMELRRLNRLERETIIDALNMLAESGDKSSQWSAKVLLEDDASFVRGLFWTSKSGVRQ